MELTEQEQALLPYMTNELYEENHSVIAKHFPIKQDAGRRLVVHRIRGDKQFAGERCRQPSYLFAHTEG